MDFRLLWGISTPGEKSVTYQNTVLGNFMCHAIASNIIMACFEPWRQNTAAKGDFRGWGSMYEVILNTIFRSILWAKLNPWTTLNGN